MADSMIERMAQALWSYEPWAQHETWDDLSMHGKAYWRERASLAVRTMREPTEAMYRAGENSLSALDGVADFGQLEEHKLKLQWQAMVDAVLAEGN
ncbi:MAG TPA: hypothetical protein VKQ27_17840 [Acetobacteraceae bacterium]|nr:hypothetical protein [Acetobacteraceae bacterium]